MVVAKHQDGEVYKSQYLTDDDGQIIHFKTKEDAVNYLEWMGFRECEINQMLFLSEVSHD